MDLPELPGAKVQDGGVEGDMDGGEGRIKGEARDKAKDSFTAEIKNKGGEEKFRGKEEGIEVKVEEGGKIEGKERDQGEEKAKDNPKG